MQSEIPTVWLINQCLFLNLLFDSNLENVVIFSFIIYLLASEIPFLFFKK